MTRPYLSKSRLMSARQCLKRLYLEVHRPELADVSAQTEAAFGIGHQVGEVAQRIYGNGGAVLIAYDDGLELALEQTARLVEAGPTAPIFEATFQHDGVLVRVDALLPDGDAWRLIEVKAATRVKDEYAADCAIQAWVAQGSGLPFSGIRLAHVDNSFVYAGEGDYRGLLTEYDISAEVSELLPAVPGWVTEAGYTLLADEPVQSVGNHCFQPYACPFTAYCWPSDSAHPVLDLGGRKAALAALVAEGYRDLRDVPAERLTAKQRRIQRITQTGAPELLPGAAESIAKLGYPRWYLDFETIMPAVPIWAGTRPYETLPFQWSCHYEPAPADLRHADFLDLSGEPPMRRFAESLIRVLAADGPVLVYTGYEKTVINRLIERFPDLDGALAAIAGRLVDLAPLAAQNFYHPSIRGSWSLKALLPLVATDLRYSELDGIQEGTAASEGYLEAIDAATAPARKAELRRQLLAYCRTDTQALVRLTRFLGEGSGRATGPCA